MDKVKDILEERQSVHGNYVDRVDAISKIMRALRGVHRQNNGGAEPSTIVEAMWHDLLIKLVRSAANPGHQDNWDDLAGYANLIREVMEAENALSD